MPQATSRSPEKGDGDLSPLYPEKRFSGSVSRGDRRAECNFRVEVDSGGAIRLSFERTPLDDVNAFLYGAVRISTDFVLFEMEGVSEDGDRIHCDRVYFTSPNAPFDKHGRYFMFAGSCARAKITMLVDTSKFDALVQCGLLGFRSYYSATAASNFGQLTIVGSKEDKSHEIAGALELETTFEKIASEKHREEMFEFLDHVLWIMSFASGTLIKDPVRRVSYRGKSEIEVFEVSEPPKTFLPAFHFLDMDEIFRLAVDTFSTKKDECRKLRTVLEWFLMKADYTESRVLGLVICFEYLCNTFLTKTDTLRKTKAEFRQIRRTLRSSLEASSMNAHHQQFVCWAVADRNKLSLKDKIIRLLAKWQIPTHDLPKDLIGRLIDSRNFIIHRGADRNTSGEEANSLWEIVLLGRELLTRVILSRIGFVGSYFSYVGGQHMRSFPSCEKLSERPASESTG